MITEQDVKELNATEFMLHIPGHEKPVNCIALVSTKFGITVKPLFNSDEELEEYILEIMKNFNKSYFEAKADILRPDYCIIQAPPESSCDILRMLIAVGDTDCLMMSNSVPILSCKFA
jgi:hypothetical protein